MEYKHNTREVIRALSRSAARSPSAARARERERLCRDRGFLETLSTSSVFTTRDITYSRDRCQPRRARNKARVGKSWSRRQVVGAGARERFADAAAAQTSRADPAMFICHVTVAPRASLSGSIRSRDIRMVLDR